jgi:hypothetical protein
LFPLSHFIALIVATGEREGEGEEEHDFIFSAVAWLSPDLRNF